MKNFKRKALKRVYMGSKSRERVSLSLDSIAPLLQSIKQLFVRAGGMWQ